MNYGNHINQSPFMIISCLGLGGSGSGAGGFDNLNTISVGVFFKSSVTDTFSFPFVEGSIISALDAVAVSVFKEVVGEVTNALIMFQNFSFSTDNFFTFSVIVLLETSVTDTFSFPLIEGGVFGALDAVSIGISEKVIGEVADAFSMFFNLVFSTFDSSGSWS